MTLKENLQQTLAGMSQFSSGTQSVSLDEGGLHFECDLVTLDAVGCAFSRLALRAPRVAAMSTDELQKLAAQLSAKLTYLLEPISPIETDSEGCVVQMRSNPPHKESDRTSYYELLVARSGQLSLVRYSRVAGQPREVIAAQVTVEVLLRLVGDFEAVAA